MNKLLRELQRTLFDIEGTLLDEVIETRRRGTFNWYLFISRDTFQLDSIRNSLMYEDIPLMFIGLKSNSKFTKDEVLNGKFDMRRKRYKDKNITYCEVPESWLIE